LVFSADGSAEKVSARVSAHLDILDGDIDGCLLCLARSSEGMRVENVPHGTPLLTVDHLSYFIKSFTL